MSRSPSSALLRVSLAKGRWVCAVALAALSGTAIAQDRSLNATPPDLSGFWSLSSKQHPYDEALVAKLPKNSVVIDDTGAAEFPRGEYGGLRLKPAALAAAKTWKPEDEMTVSRTCAVPSVVYSIQGPFPFEIYQTPALIVFRYEYFDQVRLIFMDGRAHPAADAPHYKGGHSVGHWEGDELVVDTTHISPGTITNNGLNHDDKIHMVERYRISSDNKALLATQWFEDPDVLENNGARFIRWTAKPGSHVYSYDCDPSFGLRYQGK